MPTATTLAAVGAIGGMTYSVAKRIPESGTRIALAAERSSLLHA